MKAYVIASGGVFTLVTIAHIVRIFSEGRHPLTEPVFLLFTLIVAGLSVWAWLVLRRLKS
jgi:hypothetical protein